MDFYSKCYADYKRVCYKKNSDRLESEKQFYEYYPDFNLEYYKNKYDDLKSMTKEKLFYFNIFIELSQIYHIVSVLCHHILSFFVTLYISLNIVNLDNGIFVLYLSNG